MRLWHFISTYCCTISKLYYMRWHVDFWQTQLFLTCIELLIIDRWTISWIIFLFQCWPLGDKQATIYLSVYLNVDYWVLSRPQSIYLSILMLTCLSVILSPTRRIILPYLVFQLLSSSNGCWPTWPLCFILYTQNYSLSRLCTW